MRYYFLRLLSFTKAGVGYLMSKMAQTYNSLGSAITDGVAKEEIRIEDRKTRKVEQAKKVVVNAAELVLKAEEYARTVKSVEDKKAKVKLFKLKTKVV